MCDSTGGPRRPQLGRWRRTLLALASVMAPAGAVRADRKVDLGHDGAYHLPSGIAVRPDLVALRGGLSASLPLPRPARAFAELRGVRLGAGDSVVLELGNSCASLSSMTLPLSDIEARLALAEGQALRRQGKPGEAAKAFRRALQLKADLVEAAAALVATLAAQGKQEEANQALSAAIRSLRTLGHYSRNGGLALYIALMQEPGLLPAPWEERPAMAELASNAAGEFFLGKDPLRLFDEPSSVLAVRARDGLLALRLVDLPDAAGPRQSSSELLFVDPRDSAVVASVPLESGADKEDKGPDGWQFSAKGARALRERLSLVEHLMREQGFDKVANAERCAPCGGGLTNGACKFLCSGGLEVVQSDQHAREVQVLRAGKIIARGPFPGLLSSAMLVPASERQVLSGDTSERLVLFGEAHRTEGCAGTNAPVFSVLPLSASKDAERPANRPF